MQTDQRLGQLLRLIRRKEGLTQSQLAKAADVPVRDVALVEDGVAGSVKVDRVRRMFAAVDGQARLTAWWNGASADRLLDEKHAALTERGASIYRMRRWEIALEVSFSEFGERGSIDLLAAFKPLGAAAVNEVKSAFGSLEETNRMLDVKERLAPKIATARFGWRPSFVGRVLIVPEDKTIRRIVARHAATMDAIYPARSREVRAWLRRPQGPLSGIWFLSDPRNTETISS